MGHIRDFFMIWFQYILALELEKPQNEREPLNFFISSTSSRAKMYWNQILKKSRMCPIWGLSDPLWAFTWHPGWFVSSDQIVGGEYQWWREKYSANNNCGM